MTATDSFDAVIVGGAVMGSATAYFLAEVLEYAGRVLVIERDPSYARAASSRSTSGFRQQFSTGINIALSRASAAFLKDANRLLADGDQSAGIPIHEAGYLYLSGEAHVAAFEANHALQRAHGVDVALLTADELKVRFPWLNVDDISIGSLGLSGEGWFDGYSLMMAFRRRARAEGVSYKTVAAVAVEAESGGYVVRCDDGNIVRCEKLVLTAGTGTPALARQLGVELPVTPAKQTVFSFESPLRAANMPYLFTPDGLFCRPEGADYIAGIAVDDAEADEADQEADHALFDSEVWPRLAYRAQGFEEARFRSGWAGHYDMSRFDHNPFIGAVPGIEGLFIACGFSGHGMMQSPGIGRGLAELVAYGEYRALDLSPLAFDRIENDMPIHERIQY